MRPSLTPAQAPELAEQVLAGDRLALSRVLTQVENSTPTGRRVLNLLYPHTGRAHIVGVTGSPGTGKSSLVHQLARHYRRGDHPRRVAVIAVDPTSPFTGGAVLGDRVRMRNLTGDPGVFIRSMASRGSVGGLALGTSALTQVFDAAGYEAILIETVGAGQSEVDIARLAHTTVVVEAPGLGDDIQAIKAGILEVADILVVNKADRPGADNTERALKNMLELSNPSRRLYRDFHHRCGENQDPGDEDCEPEPCQDDVWKTPVLLTIANLATGVEGLYASIQQHYTYLKTSGELERRERARIDSELGNLLQATLVEMWRSSVSVSEYHEVLDRLVDRKVSPHHAVETLLSHSEKAWAHINTENAE